MFLYVVTFYTKKMNRVKSWRVSGVPTLEKKRNEMALRHTSPKLECHCISERV